jgi:hypothetical protein
VYACLPRISYQQFPCSTPLPPQFEPPHTPTELCAALFPTVLCHTALLPTVLCHTALLPTPCHAILRLQAGAEGLLTPELCRLSGVPSKQLMRELPELAKRYGLRVGGASKLMHALAVPLLLLLPMI